jgi:small nuclear ribonucleoprotein (snRNP)-like protein
MPMRPSRPQAGPPMASPSPLKVFEDEITKLKAAVGNVKEELRQMKTQGQWGDLLTPLVGKDVDITLVSREKLSGTLTSLERYNVLLESNGKTILIMKQAIETVRPK